MATELSVAGLVARGTAAHLAGDYERAVRDLQLAYRRCDHAADAAAAFSVAFHIAMVFGTTSQPGLFNGWIGRATQILDHLDNQPEEERAGTLGIGPLGDVDPAALGAVARGYLTLLELHRAIGNNDFGGVAALASQTAEVGRTHRDPDLRVLGEVGMGRAAIYAGDIQGGLSLLDGAMASILSGETGRLATGLAWCAAVEGCQEIGAIDRVCEWTAALMSWCGSVPGLDLFTGHCSVHRGQVLTLEGRWTEALAALADSREHHKQRGDLVAAAFAERARGDILRLRGREKEAADAYRSCADLGGDPQPGLALLWLAQGQSEVAVAAVRRCLAAGRVPAQRIGILPGAVEVLLAVGENREAAELTDELDSLAALTRCASVSAAAAHAHALLELAGGDAAESLPYAHRAVLQWSEVGCPFEVARSRVVLARGLATLGDSRSAMEEVSAARAAFTELGAAPWMAEAAAVEQGLCESRGVVPPDGLTGREIEVLELVAAGRSNRLIARELVISEKTVARHLSNIFTKIDVGSRTEAAGYAFRHGLVGDREGYRGWPPGNGPVPSGS